ncbi:MAG: hypothetical protein Q9178_003179 [Gyalolechia marmorata]
MVEKLDPRQKPPDSLRALHKYYQRASAEAITSDINVYNFSSVQQDVTAAGLRVVGLLKGPQLLEIMSRFEYGGEAPAATEDVKVYEHANLPGLQILPSLLPLNTQRCLLSRLLHRDLSDPKHKTNIHFHHNVLYKSATSSLDHDAVSPNGSQKFSFFDWPPESSISFPAIDPTTHSSLAVPQFLNRKLRWMTLGGQYDWTQKAYPEENSPRFPEDIAQLTHGIFPDIRPEAAIVNVYTPGDTLSIHRDVSEKSDVGLVSISLGCDGIFIAGLEEASTNRIKHVVIRLRSGDAVHMSGPSRYAWHSVPQVLAGTCPQWLSDWPAMPSLPDVISTSSDRFEAWRGWMANKRINLNIRQIRD